MRRRGAAAALVLAAIAGLASIPVVASARQLHDGRPAHRVRHGHQPRAVATTDADRDGLTDAWETRWAVTDPARADSDGNGVPDGAEDPDGDGLGNRGEQLVGTDPSDPDSDHDTIRDGKDDANANGHVDGREQDLRPIPVGTVPTLKQAFKDRPAGYDDGCHAGPYDTKVRHCVYGEKGATFTVGTFGDSHAEQWQPALDRLAHERHWRIVSVTKSGCPSVDVRFRERHFQGALSTCVAWRHAAEAWFRAHPPQLIILASAGTYPLIDGQDKPIPADQREQAWGEGLARTLDALPAASKVLVLGDTPHLHIDPVPCLKRERFMAPCETSRNRAILPGHDATERAAAEAAGASFGSPMPLVCPYDPCPLVVGRKLVWRNNGHLTATISRALAPGIGMLIDAALPTALAVKDDRASVALGRTR
ncbi:MAG: SGNH hydrolase domain-containing protein [Chloroflexota bacterium]